MQSSGLMSTVRLLTSTQAGQLLQVSGRTVVRMAERGDLECAVKMPGPKGAHLFDIDVVQRKALELLVGVESDQEELELGLLPPERRASLWLS